jgi:Icc-related predicted phosphoesterase
MKILAFTDVHESTEALAAIKQKSADADILICAGDLTRFENDTLRPLRALDKLGKPVLIIHGNHEMGGNLEDAVRHFPNIRFFHKRIAVIDGVLFAGFGGGGFERKNELLEVFFQHSQKIVNNAEKKVFFTHAPPYGTELDKIDDSHNGNQSTRKIICKFSPDIHICGHFHENWGKKDILCSSVVLNPGPKGKIIVL